MINPGLATAFPIFPIFPIFFPALYPLKSEKFHITTYDVFLAFLKSTIFFRVQLEIISLEFSKCHLSIHL